MIPNVQIISIIFCTIMGSIFGGWLGWLESGDPFDERKFIATMLRGFFMALSNAGVHFIGISEVTIWTYVSAILIGAGFDALLKRGQGALENGD